MNVPPVPEDKPYLYTLKLDDGTTDTQPFSREQMLCMVWETIRSPKPGVRGPKPTPWTVAYQRLQQLRGARDGIRSKGDEVTKPVLLDRLGIRGDQKTLDRWLHAVPMTWKEFLAE